MQIPFALIYLAGSVLLYGASLFLPPPSVVPATPQLSDPAKATLDFLLEMNKLITTLNTAILGAAAATTVKGKEWSTHWGRVESLLILLTFLAGSVSYYGMYLSITAILGMVYGGVIYPLEARLSMALSIQYYGTLLGVFFLGLVFTRMLEGRVSARQSSPRQA